MDERSLIFIIYWLILLVSVLVGWLSVLRWQRRRKILCCNQFKCDFLSLPFVGYGHLLLGNEEHKCKVLKAFGREALKQGGLTSLHSWIVNQFFIVVADADVAELILKKRLEKDDSMKLFQRFFRESLAVVSVSHWRPRRKTMSHSFVLKHLYQYIEIFRRNSSVLAERLRIACGDDPFSIYRYISAHSFDVVSESTFGAEGRAQHIADVPELVALNKAAHLISDRITQPLYHNRRIYEMTPQYKQLGDASDVIWNYVDKNIKLKKYEDFIQCKKDSHSTETNDQNDATKTPHIPILQHMVESSYEKLSEDYLRQEAVVLLFAGTETTSVVFSFTCLMLARYHEVQEKVYQETQEVFGDSKKAIEAEDLLKLKYTEAVIKETMRMHPPVFLLLRKLDKDLVLPSGQVLVEGTAAIINVWALHRNPAYWGDDAEQFRPERFFDAPPKHPAAFIPFSYGPRNCIAYQFAMMSMKISLATVIRRYRFLPASDNDIGKCEAFRTTFDILYRDVENYPIRLQPRI